MHILTVQKLKEIVGQWDNNSQVEIKIIGPDIYLSVPGKGPFYSFYNGLSTIKVGPANDNTVHFKVFAAAHLDTVIMSGMFKDFKLPAGV